MGGVAKIMNYNKGNNDKEVSTDSVDSTKSGVTKVMTPGAPDMYEPDSADVAKIMNYNKGNNDKEVSTDSVDSTKSGVTKGDGMNDNDDGNDVGDSKEDNDEKKRKEDAMNLDDSVDDIENFILDDSEDGNDVGDTDSVEAGKPVGDVLVEPKKRKSNSQDDNDVLEDVLEDVLNSDSLDVP